MPGRLLVETLLVEGQIPSHFSMAPIFAWKGFCGKPLLFSPRSPFTWEAGKPQTGKCARHTVWRTVCRPLSSGARVFKLPEDGPGSLSECNVVKVEFTQKVFMYNERVLLWLKSLFDRWLLNTVSFSWTLAVDVFRGERKLLELKSVFSYLLPIQHRHFLCCLRWLNASRSLCIKNRNLSRK